jgi:iron complex outermembrane receptor protein
MLSKFASPSSWHLILAPRVGYAITLGPRWSVWGRIGYTYVRARETVNAIEQDVPLTPRHSAGLVGMWEAENIGRVGIEWYYTGRQSLEENPYRTLSEPYMIVGLLAEKQLGRVRLFINGENLTGVRQTRWDPLLRPTQAADGRWTVDAWAPLEGRNINGGLRIRF